MIIYIQSQKLFQYLTSLQNPKLWVPFLREMAIFFFFT
jgi:hypothetical protein